MRDYKKMKDIIMDDETDLNKYQNKCCSLKCFALSSISVICTAFFGSVIYINIICGTFTDKNICEINTICPNYSKCDSSYDL